MGYFDAGRIKPLPTYYGDQLRAVTHDVVVAGWVTAFLLIFISFLIILPGYSHGKAWKVYMRVSFDLFVGLAIVLGIYGQEWEVAEIHDVLTPYRPGSGMEIYADIGLHIGIRGINVTLKESKASGHNSNGSGGHHPVSEPNPGINYNEQFLWTWRQGRLGFGSESGQIQQDFRRAQFKGVPIPILWVAEYFTIDGEGIRFGRRYRTAGWYAHFFLWCAFVTWILQNIVMRMVVRRGARMMIITGLFILLANLVWISIRNFNELHIPFGSKKSEILSTRYGFHFWTCFLAGFESLLFGIITYVLDMFKPALTTDYFDVDPLLDYEEALLSEKELEEEKKNRGQTAVSGNIFGGNRELMVEMTPMSSGPSRRQVDNPAYGTSHQFLNAPSTSSHVLEVPTDDENYKILLRPKHRGTRSTILSKLGK